MAYNVISLPAYHQAGASITEVAGTYNDALMTALKAAKGLQMVPLDHTQVARLAKYSPLQAWTLYDGDEKKSLLTIQEM